VKSKKAKVKRPAIWRGLTKGRKGSALLVVLFIVMAITILSLGFLSRSDVELACGENMILRTQMDYLAESGLERARGLILNDSNYLGDWEGRLVEGSSDYYKVNVICPSECNYVITCDAYRGSDKMSSLQAELRLDPCIAVRTGGAWTVTSGTVVNGDIYARGNVLGSGHIYGDAFSTGTISGVNVTGQKYENVADINAPVSFPGLVSDDFWPHYYIGTNSYDAKEIEVEDLNDPNEPNWPFVTTPSNPAGVYYRDGSLTLSCNNVNVNGTLVVKDNLTIKSTGNSITAVKNFPAVVVGGELQISGNAQLAITGLAQIKSKVKRVGSFSGAELSVSGALFIEDGGFDAFVLPSNLISVTAAPNKAAVEIWSSTGTVQKRWSPVGGAFFKSIGR
jgi:hypothetical protein